MTMKTMMTESKELGKNEKLVSLIRGINEDDVTTATRFLKVDESFIRYVLGLIKDNPSMDDEGIAEMIEED